MKPRKAVQRADQRRPRFPWRRSECPAAIFWEREKHDEGKNVDVVGRPSWRSSFLGDPGAKFLCAKPQHMKNSLNFVSACLKVVDTLRAAIHLKQSSGIGPKLLVR